MNFGSILYTLLISPLETAFEVIFTVAMKLLHRPGLAILFLSLVMNTLLMPLYRRTDAIQEEAIATDKKMKPFVAHIKKTFQGDERFMMLQTCYRQHNYKPYDAVKGIAPLLLEIPFFMAAYNFLSNLAILRGCSFGPIGDLGAPDRMLVLGGLSVNLLPILMTVINLISSAIYTKGAPAKTKVQLYGMAALFLVLLYDSPAGLVMYWTLNNLFSLVKNALMKTKRPLLVLGCAATPLSVAGLIYTALYHPHASAPKWAMAVLGALLLNLPLAAYFAGKKRQNKPARTVTVTGRDKGVFFGSALLLTVLLGLTAPAALIHASPEEFIFLGSVYTPATYVLYTGLLAAGFFLVWLTVFYTLATPLFKKLMGLGLLSLAAVGVVDYMFFGKGYGTLSSQLIFADPIANSLGAILGNAAVLAVVLGVLWLLWAKKPGITRAVSFVAAGAMLATGALHMVQSQQVIDEKMEELTPEIQALEQNADPKPLFTLSKTGKNVVVLMMDRSFGYFLPYIFHEKPELYQQFTGFTYYPNTISYGGHTNLGLSAFMGGYEYTPLEMNHKPDRSLRDKHNEALQVMPKLFYDKGYKVTLNDPTYAGYSYIPNLHVFDGYEGIEVKRTMGQYNRFRPDPYRSLRWKFFFYSVFRTVPTGLNRLVYDKGHYLTSTVDTNLRVQTRDGLRQAMGMDSYFENSSEVLTRLPELTRVTDNGQNTFQYMCNETSHEPTLLQLPDYTHRPWVDNRPYDEKNPVREDGKGHRIVMTTDRQVTHYHCNAATFLQLGTWLEYLKKEGIYDNTRIIIAGDHGINLYLHEETNLPNGEDMMQYIPTLLVKDFNAAGQLKTDETFMTNADVPTLAVQGLIDNPANPFTGQPLDSRYKERERQYISVSHDWDINKNNKNTYSESAWYAVKPGNVLDRNNWTPMQQSELPGKR